MLGMPEVTGVIAEEDVIMMSEFGYDEFSFELAVGELELLGNPRPDFP